MTGPGKTILLFPTAMEALPLQEKLSGKYQVEICGIGPVACAAHTAATIVKEKPALIILAGIAGAYVDSGLSKGDTVIVLRENIPDLGTLRGEDFRPLPAYGADHSLNFYGNKPPMEFTHDLPQVISNTVVTAGTGFRNPALLPAQIENMEGAGFFAVCNALGMPCIQIRSISNFVGEEKKHWKIEEAVGKLSGDVVKLLEKL